MHVLAALGWTLLVLLVLAILAVVLPAKVLVDWRDGEWTLRARVLFLTFRLYPRRARTKRGTDAPPPPAEQPPEKQPEQAEEKNGEPEKRQEQENQPESETKQEPEKKQEPDGARNGKKHRKKRRRMPWGKIVQSVRTASGFIRRVLRFVRVDDIELCLPVHEEDAAQTAIQYGRIQAGLGTLVAVLRNVVRLDFKKVNIFADFDGVCEKQAAFSCKIGAPPVIIAVAAIWAYLRLTEAEVL